MPLHLTFRHFEQRRSLKAQNYLIIVQSPVLPHYCGQENPTLYLDHSITTITTTMASLLFLLASCMYEFEVGFQGSAFPAAIKTRGVVVFTRNV